MLHSDVKYLFIILLFGLFLLPKTIKAQKDSTLYLAGAIQVTNNGFSNIPTFTLGKPAAIFNFTTRSNRLSFEPEMRFSYEGKLWSILLWGRYKLVEKENYQLRVGLHPGFAFNSQTSSIGSETIESQVVRRYLTGEISQTFKMNNHLSSTVYYLYANGRDVGTPKNTHYLAYILGVSNLKVSENLSFNVIPQVFYLRTGGKEGYYFSSALQVKKQGWPVHLGAMMNKSIRSEINAKDFNWNLSLHYTFRSKFNRN
ncbi:hypothetical protein SAMN06298216_0801 [Spirosomataceae bacterium TFI 002]|nr:hypothetical protein SAMN06298216_0801 [Spirosomataceae bacterium TFI 002]